MSLWEFTAAVGGFVKANRTDDSALTTEQVDQLADWLDEPPVWN